LEKSKDVYFEGLVKITYDTEADAAYIYLMPEGQGEGAIVRQVQVEDGPSESDVILDIENSKILHGIEILGASECLPSVLIDQLTTPPTGQN